jgi:hypothetical protein
MFTFKYCESIINIGSNVIVRQDDNESNDEYGYPPKCRFWGGLIASMTGEIQN